MAGYRSNDLTKSLNEIFKLYGTPKLVELAAPLKTDQELKARFSIERGNKDNITITLLSTDLSFELIEHKTKRRYLNEQSPSKDLRPTYEEVYDGMLQIDWRARKAGYYRSDKSTALLSYSDTDAQLENQIPAKIRG